MPIEPQQVAKNNNLYSYLKGTHFTTDMSKKNIALNFINAHYRKYLTHAQITKDMQTSIDDDAGNKFVTNI